MLIYAKMLAVTRHARCCRRHMPMPVLFRCQPLDALDMRVIRPSSTRDARFRAFVAPSWQKEGDRQVADGYALRYSRHVVTVVIALTAASLAIYI